MTRDKMAKAFTDQAQDQITHILGALSQNLAEVGQKILWVDIKWPPNELPHHHECTIVLAETK